MTSEALDAKQDVRADVWLWAARFFKTRSLAKQAIDGGKVVLNGHACKASKPVRVGDTVQVTRGEERLSVTVQALSSKRGPAAQAQTLYQETEASRQAREAQKEQRRLTGAGLSHPPGRPSKQDRRLIRRFKDAALERPD